MARTIADIQASIIAAKNAQPALAALSSPSAVAVWRLWTYVTAVCHWTLEKLFDLHLAEVKDIISKEKAHREQWYAMMALRFQYGHTLVPDKDYYDNAGISDAQVELAKIVKYSAVEKVMKGLRIKVAKVVNGELAPLSTGELAALKAYFDRVGDGGVRLYFASATADSLKLHLTVYYDALVLDGSGARLDGAAATPVKDAITTFLKVQPFNGLFVVAQLIDALQRVGGVLIPHPVSVQARYGALPYTSTPVEYLPDAGYLRILNPSDLTTDYVPHEPF